IEGEHILYQESHVRSFVLRPVLLEGGFNVEADIPGGRSAFSGAVANGAKHAAGRASDVAHGCVVLYAILGELDAVIDQFAVATYTQFNVTIKFIRIVCEREWKLGGLIDQRWSSRRPCMSPLRTTP